jgi:hypothetical protein
MIWYGSWEVPALWRFIVIGCFGTGSIRIGRFGELVELLSLIVSAISEYSVLSFSVFK